MSDLESRAVTVLRDKDLSFVEIATVCTAFYKSNYNHSSLDFMNLLRDVLFASDLWRHPSYHIVGILKVFCHNYYGYSSLFERLGDQIAKEAHRYPIKSIMQFVVIFATLHNFHKDLMDVASREVLQKIEQCRSKDVAKIIWSFVTLNYEPTDWKLVVDVLQARVEELGEEMATFPIYFISFLLSLAYINVYPSDLLKKVFSDGFLQHIKDYEEREGVDLRSNLFTLHAAASLESPVKLEQRLNLEYLTSKPFPHQMLGDIREELKQRSELREVADCVKSIVGGSKYCRVHFILPYMRTADIEICLDDTNSPLPNIEICLDDTNSPLPNIEICLDDTNSPLPNIEICLDDTNTPLPNIEFPWMTPIHPYQ
ncbi:FAST kinase domain-containing protein 5, mitochondrial-like isoform X5 [Apostichopus japonicus]|uniref:FAST kinase domain-containing protein 5, mitochondrial-like isoform X3 n=1 Tax=Stichopus japonicus TaxID=307972 RepID=UPI003AB5721A